MVNVSFIPLALVAALAAFGEARNCTPKLNHCGHYLLDIGRYYTTIFDELHRAKGYTCLKKEHVTKSLFYCGANGEIRYKQYCANGCQVGAIGEHDYCFNP
ncbi:hypothetical protein FDECE_2698 [Fusarium decemcellulare]|nr:hypothetical protein FDECE_2698 [Fusarium decemcellulare]